jgi:hypothetical protein
MLRQGFFLALLWGVALFLLFRPSSPSPWLRTALREGVLPSTRLDLGTITALKIPLQLLGEQAVTLRAAQGVPQTPSLGFWRLGGGPHEFHFKGVRVAVKGLLFEAERGELKANGLQLFGRVQVSRSEKILLEGPSLFLAAKKDWISSKDLVLLTTGKGRGKKSQLELSLPSRALK